MTYDDYVECFNAVFTADAALNRVEARFSQQTESGTFDAFRLLRLAVAGFMARLHDQAERCLPTEAADTFGAPSALLAQQRLLTDFVFQDMQRSSV